MVRPILDDEIVINAPSSLPSSNGLIRVHLQTKGPPSVIVLAQSINTTDLMRAKKQQQKEQAPNGG